MNTSQYCSVTQVVIILYVVLWFSATERRLSLRNGMQMVDQDGGQMTPVKMN